MPIIIVELFFIAIPCLYFSLKFPPSSVAICLLFSQYESTGIGAILAQYAPHAYMIMTACIFIAYLRSLVNIRKRIMYYTKARFHFFLRLIFAISVLMLISIIINGYSVFSLVFFVPLSTVIAAGYWQNRAAIRLYLVVLTIHLTIAIILTSPLLSSFPWLSLLYVRPQQLSDLSDIGSRQSAQFSHVTQLAYYSGIGLITGVWLAFQGSTRKVRVLGFYLSLISIWMNLVTATRAIWFALILAVTISLYRKSGLKHMMIKLAFGLIIILLALSSIKNSQNATNNIPFNRIANRFASMEVSEFSATSYRIEAMDKSYDAIKAKPIFGYGDFYTALEDIYYMPHQMPIYFALIYGIPVGLFVLLLLITSIRFDFSIRSFKTRQINNMQIDCMSPDSRYFTAIAWLNILVAITNGAAGRMFQWVIIGVCCARWVYQPDKNKYIIRTQKFHQHIERGPSK